MDKHHFGDSKCAVDFVEIIQKQFPKRAGTISCFLNKTNEIFSILENSIIDPGVLKHVGGIYLKYKFQTLDHRDLPDLARSYMKNLIRISYRKHILKQRRLE